MARSRRTKKDDPGSALAELREGLSLVGEAVDKLADLIGDGEGDDADKGDGGESGGRRRRSRSGGDDEGGDAGEGEGEGGESSGTRGRRTRKKTTAKKSTRKKKDEGPTADDVRAVMLKVIEEFGSDECEKILEEIADVKRVSDLEEDDFQAVIDECEKALAE